LRTVWFNPAGAESTGRHTPDRTVAALAELLTDPAAPPDANPRRSGGREVTSSRHVAVVDGGPIREHRMVMADTAVRAEGLVKTYGETKALQGLDLEIEQGTVLGMLGPNGAGKTTAVKILTTLQPADAGRAWVAGYDVREDPDAVRSRIGLTGQYAAVDEHLTGAENLTMIGRLNGLARDDARARARQLLDRFGLSDAADRSSKTYSGGMRRRLDLSASLVARPAVLFLDEPTTGLDPASRLSLWAVIREILSDGTTVLLTTQYLEEADQLADDILVIDRGAEIARGTSRELKAKVGGERIEFHLADRSDCDVARRAVGGFAGDELHVDERTGALSFPIHGDNGLLAETVRALDDAGLVLDDLSLRRPSLDDVFLTLTGRSADGTADDMQESA
jgi:ABC-2 type transport system ATP-binding protein